MAKVYVKAMKDIQLGEITKRKGPNGKILVDDFTTLKKKDEEFWVDEEVWRKHDAEQHRDVIGKKGFVIATLTGALLRIPTPDEQARGERVAQGIPTEPLVALEGGLGKREEI
jgi:hypothetical protein